MADPHSFSFTKKSFSYEFDILNISDQFRGRTLNKGALAVQEVLGSHPEIQVDLIWNFDDASDEEKEAAKLEKIYLQRDYGRLEKKWKTNLKNKLPRWAGFDDDDVFISTEKYKKIFRPKIIQPKYPATIPDDSR